MRAVPVVGPRIVDQDDAPELWPVETIGCGRRRWSCFDGAWRGPSDDTERARPLDRLEEVLRADDAHEERGDAFGRRFRWRAPTAPDEPMPKRLTPTRVVSWGWAWLDGEGRVRRVQSTHHLLRARARSEQTAWTLLELVEVDVPVTIEEPVAAPWPEPAS